MNTILLTVVTAGSLFFAIALPGGAQPPNRPADLPPPSDPPKGTVVYRDLVYVPNGGLYRSLDLFVPPGSSKAPLIVYIHGGAFRYGDKQSALLPMWVLGKGYAVASLNYRVSGEAIFPAGIQDCKAAVRWLRANAGKYRLDADRFVAWGESSGANFAVMLGTSGGTFDVGPNLQHSSAVQGVVDYYGPTDFLQMDSHALPGSDKHSTPDSPESLYLGGNFVDRPGQVELANPMTYITKKSPPFFIAHGDQDHVVPIHQSEILVNALKKKGVSVTFHVVKGTDHGFRGATPEQKRQLDEKTAAFLESVFSSR